MGDYGSAKSKSVLVWPQLLPSVSPTCKALESCKERKLFYFYGKGSAKSSVFNIFINFERRASLM